MKEIDISVQIENFKEHIDIEENLRIVVSGAFGSGKTYFLNKFFNERPHYNVIRIFPVNYSIAKNEDIFELIKFDILFELLNHPNSSFDKEYFTKLLTAQVFVDQHADEILKPIVEAVPKIGKSISKIAEALFKFGKDFDAFHKKVQVDEKNDAINYLKKIKGIINSIEEDSITELIRTSLNRFPKDKKTILLIDDLDRIDPDHIFRILNVFSSHFDIQSNQNKFFFDKIILVCDIENIRTIFHARYGSNIDFSGYIDKFYSRNIFRFDNNSYVELFIGQSIHTIKLNKVGEKAIGIKASNVQYNFFVNLMRDLLSRNYINLRKLINLKNLNFSRTTTVEVSLPRISLNRLEYPIIVLIELLIEILGSKKILLEAIGDLKNFKTSLESQSYYYAGLIIPLLDIEQNKSNYNNEYTFKDPNDNIVFDYILKNNSDDIYFAEIRHNIASPFNAENISFNQPNVLDLLYKLIQQLDNYKVI